MKCKCKNKCKYIKENKILSKIIFLTIIFIVIFTFFLLNKFNKNINNHLIDISSNEINRLTYTYITKEINNKVLNKNTINDILILTKNNDGEILYVDFDLDKAYNILDNISNILNDKMSQIENGNASIAYLDEQLSHKTNSLILSIPFGSTLKSNYFYNFGPTIPVKINFIGSILTNLETKITNYGLNNALVELFVYIEFTSNIITPFKTKEIKLKYDTVIASMMIEGKVPSYSNGIIEKSTGIFNQNLS